MNKLKATILVLIILAVPMAASAQFSMGIRAGMAIDNLKLNEDAFKADNTLGFVGGIMAELIMPVVGVGVDAALLYRYSGSTIEDVDNEIVNGGSNSYLDVPIHLKWKMSIPAVNNILAPMIFTGPCFSVLLSEAENAWKSKTFDTSWDIGAGVELFSKLQVSVAYSLALSNALDLNDTEFADLYSDIDLKNNFWTINLAYIF
ncbi:MAG: outer membrane beta-barrel protein [Bacteroidales bacterium]